MTTTLKIDLETIRHSSRIADGFMNENEHLQDVYTYSEYNQRLAGFADIVDGETGYTSFTPFVKMDVSQTWSDLLHNSEYDAFFDKVNGADYDYNERVAWGQLYWSLRGLSHADIIARNVPAALLDTIKAYKQAFESFKKCPVSPKLTKLVGYLFGEKAGGAMDYLTTKCPREDKAGELDEYRIFVSVLPHNIAGMSFYSSNNHGGASWQGYHGTSCQDPRRSHDASLINHLPASIAEQTSAVAWLAKREHNDVWYPVYEARSIIRIVPCELKNVFIICKPYYTNPTVRNILIEGLKSNFPNMMIFGEHVDRWNVECTDIEVDIYNCQYDGVQKCECYHCSGTGEIEEECRYCDGTGHEWEVCEECDGHGHDDEGECCECCGGDCEHEEECSECDGRGHNNETCPLCDGVGYYEESAGEFLPYIDDTGIIDLDYDMITYTLPTELLVKMGAIVEESEEFDDIEELEDIEA